MPKILEYDVVQVVTLAGESRHYDGTEGIMRAPMEGDIGTVCHVYDSKNQAAPVIVEMVDSDGMTVWLAEFYPCELRVVESGY